MAEQDEEKTKKRKGSPPPPPSSSFSLKGGGVGGGTREEGGQRKKLKMAEEKEKKGQKIPKKKGGKKVTQKKQDRAVEFRRAFDLWQEAGEEICFTDGSCLKNGKPGGGAGGAAAIHINTEKTKTYVFANQPTTNQVAELTAIGLALDLLAAQEERKKRVASLAAAAEEEEEKKEKKGCDWRICTDSNYAIGLLENGSTWTAKANIELVEGLRKRLHTFRKENGQNVHFSHVPAHCGIEWNERVDTLANNAAHEASKKQQHEKEKEEEEE